VEGESNSADLFFTPVTPSGIFLSKLSLLAVPEKPSLTLELEPFPLTLRALFDFLFLLRHGRYGWRRKPHRNLPFVGAMILTFFVLQ